MENLISDRIECNQEEWGNQRGAGAAGRADTTPRAGKRDRHLVMAIGAAGAGEALLQVAALEKGGTVRFRCKVR